MKSKKIIIPIIAIILIISIVVIFINIQNKQKEEKIKSVLTDFIGLINEKKYEEMYEKVEISNEMNKEDFIARNKNIYEGIESQNIKVEITNLEKVENNYKIDYHETMYTGAGEVQFDNNIVVIEKNKEYKIKWSSSFIFPQLGESQKVRISTIKAKRGDILDRNNVKLATEGTILSVGIVPGKLGENKEQNIEKLSNLTEVSVEYINQQLKASWVREDTFVPIKKISKTNITLKNELLQIPGILINEEKARIYNKGEEAGHLIGYVQPVSNEDLQKNEGKGYNTSSLIGKSGLEKIYEETLRAVDGAEIYIVDENENKVAQIIKQDKKDGKDIKLTIDSNLQKNIYAQIKESKGFFVVMHPKTGELLALVSTPTFDSNDFVLGMTNSKWESLNNDEKKPLYNRFLQKYCPGSTFKPITGAIGLATGKMTANEDYGYTGTSWQKDNSWGDYKITTLKSYNSPKNLVNGLIYSDNIYFAQTALKIGASTFAENLNKLGFNEQIEFPFELAKSQYANNNEEKINGEIKLADSGYGQGSILVNPIHMASIYSAFANEGNMIKPYLEYKENSKAEIFKQAVFSAEIANTIKQALIQVVENENGTAHDVNINGKTIAGKTGTAELKTSNEDSSKRYIGLV